MMPTFGQQGPTLLEQLQAETRRKTAALPPEKKIATVVTVDWVYGAPLLRWGTAVRTGEHFELGLETQTKFTKASTSGSIYVMWSK